MSEASAPAPIERPEASPAVENFVETLRRAFPTDLTPPAFATPLRRIQFYSNLTFTLRTVWFAALLCGFSAVVLWGTERSPPVLLLESRLAATAQAGGDIASTTRVFRSKVCATKLERAIIDSAGTRFDVQDLDWQAFGAEGEDIYTQLVPVDARAAPGPARMDVVLTFTCNPLHRLWPIIVRRPPRAFLITRGAGDGP